MEEYFGDYKASHTDTRYNIKCSCRHFWYGKTYSTKFVLDEIKIATSLSKSVKYNFDEDETNNDEAGSADSEPEEVVESETVVESDNESEPEDSD